MDLSVWLLTLQGGRGLKSDSPMGWGAHRGVKGVFHLCTQYVFVQADMFTCTDVMNNILPCILANLLLWMHVCMHACSIAWLSRVRHTRRGPVHGIGMSSEFFLLSLQKLGRMPNGSWARYSRQGEAFYRKKQRWKISSHNLFTVSQELNFKNVIL